MDRKKELIIKVLEKLLPYRDLAEVFLQFFKSEYCTNQIVNFLAKVIYDSATEIDNLNEKESLKKWIDLIKQIHKSENIEQEYEKEELVDLESEIKNL